MESSSAFSPFFPTSSSTLEQHSCGRLLWLPLSTCLKMAGEHVRSLSTSSSLPPLSQQSVRNSFARGGGGGSGSLGAFLPPSAECAAEDDLVSGFELRFKHACVHSPAMPMHKFRECFVANSSGSATTNGRSPSPSPVGAAVATQAPPHYRADAKLRFLIADDAGASQWENIDTHRMIQGVIVVMNTASLLNVSFAQVLEVVRTVFHAQYRDKVCRCFVVTQPPPQAPSPSSADSPWRDDSVAKLLASLPSRTFVPVDPTRPIESTAAQAMEGIGRDVVFTLNASLNQLKRAIATVSSSKTGKSKIDLSQLRTPLDMQATAGGSIVGGGSGGGGANGSLEGLKTNLITSRLAKKRGDVFALLGATDVALQEYGDTQFASNADALWCAATLESIAAARYQQWCKHLAPQLPALCAAVADMQSDETKWTERAFWEQKMTQLEQLAANMCDQVQQALACFKGPCVPNSMRQRLVKEVEEPLIAKAAQLSITVAKVRVCLEAGTNEIAGDPAVYFVATELKLCVEEMVRLGLSEVDVYLKESLRQQRHATTAGNRKTLQDRDLETRLKSLSFLVDRGAVEAFTAEVSDVRALFRLLYGDVVQNVLRFFTLLCVRCRCRRKATAFLVETAYNDRRNKLYASTIQSLIRACFLSGIALGSIPELHAAVLVDPLCRLYAAVSSSPGAARGMLSPNSLPPPALAATAAAADATSGHASLPSTAAVAGTDGGTSQRATTAMIQSANTAEPSFYSAFGGGEDLHPNQGTSKRNELALTSLTMQQHIPLLMELLDALHEADCRGSVRCQLATLLLFRYPTYLDRNTSQLLTDIARSEALRLEPHVRPATAALPFLSAWEALSLPPNLSPKTVSVGGPFFTFIDTARLKLTILSLNGRRLNSRVVWCVGDVGTVMVSLYNPYHWPITLLSLSLQARACSDLDEENGLPPDAVSHTTGPLAPTCYVLSKVVLPPVARTRVLLQVLPKMPGFLRIEGVQLRPEHLKGATLPVQGKLPEPMGIPVLQQLPLVSCTVSVSELEVFSGQCIDFTVRVVNCGQLPIAHISLTAHGEACQLEDCEGCKERASSSDITVLLNKAALEAACRAPLRPGDVVTIPVHLQAPPQFDVMESHFVIFRVDCSLPHGRPTMPPNVPSAVPVFGVIPRRVTETRMRVFYAPTLAVTSLRLTKDKRFVDVRLVNRSERYSVELALSSLPFADLPDALLMAGADYVVPPVDISRVSDHGKVQGSFLYKVPWTVRELPHCTGTLTIDLGLVADEVVCNEPLDELLVSVDVVVPTAEAGGRYLSSRHWSSHGLPLGSISRRRRGRRSTPHADSGHHHHDRGRSQDTADTSDSDASNQAGSEARLPSPRSALSSGRPSSPHPWESRASAIATDAARGGHGSDTAADYGAAEEVAMPPSVPDGEDPKGRLAATAPPKESGGTSSSLPIVLPAVTPIQLHLRARAGWRRAVPLRFSLSMTNHLDVGVLSGPVESVAAVGEQGRCVCEQRFELLAFKTGEHAIKITIRDSADREIAHVMRFIVQHGRD